MERQVYTPRSGSIVPQRRLVSSSGTENRVSTRKVIQSPRVFNNIASPREHVPKQDNRSPIIESYDSDRTNRDQRMEIYKVPPSTFEMVDTPYGKFKIPNYSLMTNSDIQIHRNSYANIIAKLNDNNKEKLDQPIALPTRSEPIRELAIRTMQAEAYINSTSGSDVWFVLMCIGWVFIESTCKSFGFPCKGYATSQIKTYKPVYKKYLQQFSITMGFGKDWPPWMQVGAVTATSLLLNIVLRKSPAMRKQSDNIIAFFTQQMIGSTEDKSIIRYDEKGAIKNIEESEKKVKEESSNPLSGMMNMFSGALEGNGNGLDSMINNMMTMFSPPERTTPKERKRKRKERAQVNDFGI